MHDVVVRLQFGGAWWRKAAGCHRATLILELRLRMEPVANDASTFLVFRWPVFEAEVRQLVAFYAERVHDNLGGAAAVVALDCLLKKISHVSYTPAGYRSCFLPIFLFGQKGFQRPNA